MPVVSGALTASGVATVAWIGRSTAGCTFFSFSSGSASWVADLSGSTGVLTADGAATVAASGEGVRTAVAEGVYTYDPTAATTFIGGGGSGTGSGGGGGGAGTGGAATSAGNSIFRRDPPPIISGNLGTTSSRMTVRVGGAVPPLVGQDVQVDFGDGFGTIFAGTIQTVVEVFQGRPTQVAWDITIVDYLWLLAGECPRECFSNASATVVVQALMSRYGLGFTVTNVQASLPVVTVEFDGSKNLVECLQEIANQVGACYMFVDAEQDLHFFQTDATDPPDQLNNTTTRTLLFTPSITYERDGSQIRNRVSATGASTTTTAPTYPGAREIHVTDGELFQGSGNALVGCQLISFSGFRRDVAEVAQKPPVPELPPTDPDAGTNEDGDPGGGTPSGSGTPSGGALATPNAFNAQMALGPYPFTVLDGKIHLDVAYAITFIGEAGQESAMSDIVYPLKFGQWRVAPSSCRVTAVGPGGNVPTGVLLSYAVSFYTSNGETEPMFVTDGSFTLHPLNTSVDIEISPMADPRVLGAHIWRREHNFPVPINVPQFYLVGESPGNTLRTFTDVLSNTRVGKLAPLDAFGDQRLNNTGAQVVLSRLPLNADRPRKLWRRTARVNEAYGPNGFWRPWTLLATLTDFNQTEYTDNAETPRPDQDRFYGDPVPIPSGGGATTPPPPMPIGGGPTGGPTPAPPTQPETPIPVIPPILTPPLKSGFIIGVSGVTEMIPAGATIALYAQVDSIASQAEWAAQMGGSGVRAMPLVRVPSLKTSAQLYTFAQSVLDTFLTPIETLRYSTLDTKTRIGKDIDVDLTDPPIVTTLKIQSVTLDVIQCMEGKPARYNVVASSVKFTLQDFMRAALLAN